MLLKIGFENPFRWVGALYRPKFVIDYAPCDTSLRMHKTKHVTPRIFPTAPFWLAGSQAGMSRWIVWGMAQNGTHHITGSWYG